MWRRLYRLLLCLLALVLALPGCAQRQTAESAELSTFHAGSLHLPDNPAAPKRLYLDCREGASVVPRLANQLAAALKGSRFRLADKPSDAGYILHVNILRRGSVAPQALKAAVNAGYGAAAKFTGAGSEGMLADAILVQRKVPKAGKGSQRQLRNISARNALGSGKMRIGVLASDTRISSDAFSAALARELALRVEK